MKWPWQRRRGAGRDETPAQPQTFPPQIPKDRQLRLQSLTPRESEVFGLLVQGKKLREIAEALSVQYSTVNTHQKSIYKKLGVNSRAECILLYIK